MDELTVGIAALERAPLFAGLDREDLQKVLGCRQRVSFERGQAIVERWDPGDAMYILVSGAAEVDVGGRFHRLERGDFFGEMAVLASQRREASVKAVEPVEALRIPADGLQAFLLDNPRVAVRRPPSSRAISPRTAPGPTSVTGRPSRSTSSTPSNSRNSLPPGPPCSTRSSPGWSRTNRGWEPMIVADSCRSRADSTAVTSAGDCSSPHGVCCPNDRRYQLWKSIRPLLAARWPVWS